jgi:hypothetical protein
LSGAANVVLAAVDRQPDDLRPSAMAANAFPKIH